MIPNRKNVKHRLDELNSKVFEDFDYDFSAVSKRIVTMDEFYTYLYKDFISEKRIFYRGERINSADRHLLPTMLRNNDFLFGTNYIGVRHIDSKFLYNYYLSLGGFVELFSKTMGQTDENHLYRICAFAQHYCNTSPLIDFSKSLYPSLSFALKDRKEFDEDIVIYTVELKNEKDYTDDISVANKWLKDINIFVSHYDEKGARKLIKDLIDNPRLIASSEDFKSHLERMNTMPTPSARLIDCPTNTRMRFQQGVFLLLNDFQMFNHSYFTKNIRDKFEINKYVINKEICPMLVDLIHKEAPWYSYKYLTDIESAFKIAIDNGTL